MATYETKKRGIFGKFSGFPAGKSKPPGEKASGRSYIVLFSIFGPCLISSVKVIRGWERSGRV